MIKYVCDMCGDEAMAVRTFGAMLPSPLLGSTSKFRIQIQIHDIVDMGPGRKECAAPYLHICKDCLIKAIRIYSET